MSAPSVDPPAPVVLLTPRATAAALAISPRSLWSITSPRGPLRALRIGRAVRYSVDAIRAYVAARQAQSGGAT